MAATNASAAGAGAAPAARPMNIVEKVRGVDGCGGRAPGASCARLHRRRPLLLLLLLLLLAADLPPRPRRRPRPPPSPSA